jgi:hypothetical protein
VLNFNGDTVAVDPILEVTYGTDPNGTLPAQIALQLNWNGSA